MTACLAAVVFATLVFNGGFAAREGLAWDFVDLAAALVLTFFAVAGAAELEALAAFLGRALAAAGLDFFEGVLLALPENGFAFLSSLLFI